MHRFSLFSCLSTVVLAATFQLATAVDADPPSNGVCFCTEYSQISVAVASCTAITLQDIAVPDGGNSIDLSKLKDNSVVTFAGKTTFGFTNSSSFDPIILGGKGVTITSAPGAIIDGNGQAYWDGIGSNGGVPKPNHFIVVKLTSGSVIKNLHIRNWPVHLFTVSHCSDLVMRDMVLDNREGDVPNARSAGLAAAHNSDGFDVGSSTNVLITNTTVYNQDDCVAVTSGNNITVDNMYCSGGHGLSIGSIGGKSDNTVTNIKFSNSVVVDSSNGPRIKTNFDTTGLVSNITYSNISLQNISSYGIDVQQDYLNGGPTGSPSNGVLLENILFDNVTGTATSSAKNYYVLCGEGSCKNIVFQNVDITGGQKSSSCNFPESGCPT
ncbi:putative polygalacturonase [Venustampulla echinocandica]|uniref:endo-polygalacturonase n=1 Tax=Venustampulla echinocandica TaxID=2656787 RepID=A0A370TG22_9HELO|nr:putative polygalacturonase [Venustampulla echinocandica]RDL33839.1 putative polygalacturonase [Venustampulla echinocandica]